MRCQRCGKDNPPSVHTCTAPTAIYLAEQIEAVYEAPHLPRKAAAELRRLYEELEGTAQRNRDIYGQLDKAEAEIDALRKQLKMANLDYSGCMEDLKEAEKAQANATVPALNDADSVDCPRCGHCCPDDTALLKQALSALTASRDLLSTMYLKMDAIAALHERLK
jgi:hypothetical protein